MKASMNIHTSTALLALLFVATIVSAQETSIITESITQIGDAYDGKTVYIGNLNAPRVLYGLRRPNIVNRGLRIIGKDTPETGHIFSCQILNPVFYTGTFSISKYFPTNSIVSVDAMVATMQSPMSVVDLKDAYLSNNITIVIIRGTVTYSGGASAPVVSMVTRGSSVLSKSTLSIVGLRVTGAASVLSIGDSASMEDAKIMGDAMLTIDKCTVADLGVAAVDFRSGMTLSDHSIFRVSELTMSRGSAPVVRYASGRGQRMSGASLYVMQNIDSRNGGSVFYLESGGQAPFFTADSRSTVSFLDITATSMGVTESVPRSPSGAQVYGQQCRFNNALVANTVDAYNNARIAATKVLTSLHDVATQQCQPALCVPEYTTSTVENNNVCGCACAPNKQQNMCSTNRDPALGFVLCNADPNCYRCITPNLCSECVPTHTLSNTGNTCVKSACTEPQCDVCLVKSDCVQCKEFYSLVARGGACRPCRPENCRFCVYGSDSQCEACTLGYTVSNGACIPYVPCTAPNCDKCRDGSSDTCERCAPSFGTTSAGTCQRCAAANCLACGDGSGACTECANGFKVTGNGCEPDAATGLLRTGWLVLALAVVTHAACFF